MKYLLLCIAVISSKIIELISKILGRKSSVLPGKIARMIYPNILSDLWKQLSHDTMIVTGTNGKTTTNNLMRDILKFSGKKVVCNDVGANMLNGVTSAFLKSTNFSGKLNANYACIEVDEATLHQVFNEITPNKIVITNLFRDQLDRYGEIDLIVKSMEYAFDKIKHHDIELFLNADDPLTAQFKYKFNFKTYFYGIDNGNIKSINELREGRFCSFCGEELQYNFYFYSQLGDFYCNNCGFKRPPRDYAATNIQTSEKLSFDFKYKNNLKHLTLNYIGFYNIYNCLAAISATINMIENIEHIQNALSNYKPQIGRMEKFNLPKPVILNLSKNPAGFNQTLDTVLSDPKPKNVLIAINDNAQDGRDISWLWDCDFEKLLNSNTNKFFVSGLRKEDMAIRLKYGEISEEKIFIEDDIKQAIFKLVDDDNIDIAYTLVNYTALFETQNILKSLEKVYRLDVEK